MLALIRNILVLGTIAITVSSCATMNKDECLTADWKTIGYGDGTNGYEASRIAQHTSACAEHKIRPDLNAYNQGRDQGLNQYCIPSTGYNKGASGYRYNGVCSGHNEGAFVDALNYGLTVHSAVSRLNSLKSNYSQQEQYIAQLELSLQQKENQIVSGKISKLKAYKLLNETKEMAEELGKAKSSLGGLQDEINGQAHHVSELTNQRRYN